MKQTIKKLLFFFINLLTPKADRGAIILMYHSVGDNKALFTVRPDMFERQISLLKRHKFNFLKISELVERHNSGGSLKNIAVVTFDDGYEDNYTNALPILKKYSIPATVFVSTGYIGKILTTSDDITLPIMTEQLITDLSNNSLVECMPHGHLHEKLAMRRLEEVRDDIGRSREIIQKLTNNNADCFAYPYGNYSEDIIGILKILGFKGAVTVKDGTITSISKTYELPRISISSQTSMSEFTVKVLKTRAYLIFRKFI